MKPRYETLNRVGADSLKKHTGKNWDQWIAILNRAGASEWSHQTTAIHLRDRHRLGPWWQQIVTTGYEIAIGKRIEGRNLKGEFSVSISRTFPVDRRTLWQMITSAQGLAVWLRPMSEIEFVAGNFFERDDGIFGQIRTMKSEERVRLTWQDGEMSKKSVLQLYLIKRKGSKSVLALSHNHLVDGRWREPLRALWKQALEDLLKLSADFSADGSESKETASAAKKQGRHPKSPGGNSAARRASSRKSVRPKRK